SLSCLQGGQALQAGCYALPVDVALEQQGQTLVIQATGRGRITLRGQDPREAETQMHGIRLHPHLLAGRQAVFEQGTCRLQLTLLQAYESQQAERKGAEGG